MIYWKRSVLKVGTMAERDLKVGIRVIQAAVWGSHTFPEFKQMHVPFFFKTTICHIHIHLDVIDNQDLHLQPSVRRQSSDSGWPVVVTFIFKRVCCANWSQTDILQGKCNLVIGLLASWQLALIYLCAVAAALKKNMYRKEQQAVVLVSQWS